MYVCMYRNLLKKFENYYWQQRPIVIEEQTSEQQNNIFSRPKTFPKLYG